MSHELSRCPHCGARGVKLTDVLVVDGYSIVTEYCGKCGKNHPKPKQPLTLVPRDGESAYGA